MARNAEVKESPASEVRSRLTVAEPTVKDRLAAMEAKQPKDQDKVNEARIKESRKILAGACPTGMRFFEAPDGFVIVAEASNEQVWYSHGKMWINPRRA